MSLLTEHGVLKEIKIKECSKFMDSNSVEIDSSIIVAVDLKKNKSIRTNFK